MPTGKGSGGIFIENRCCNPTSACSIDSVGSICSLWMPHGEIALIITSGNLSYTNDLKYDPNKFIGTTYSVKNCS